MATSAASNDAERVAELLGRVPQGTFEVIVRDAAGEPLVLRNNPLMFSGRPMPTLYWLAGKEALRRVSRLEAAGGVRAAQAAIPAAELAAAHQRYSAERDAHIPPGHTGPRPSGGVAGTREGVKCLHAHYAYHLAGGDDPVGRWVAARLAAQPSDTCMTTLHISLTDGHAVFADHAAGVQYTVPVGASTLAAMIAADPPLPEELTNAIGIFMDHIEDVTREVPSSTFADVIEVRGPGLQALVDTEVGHSKGLPFNLSRDAVEEVFRTLATETAADRACNPGLPTDEVHHVLGVCCAVVAMLRALHASELVVIADSVAE